MTDAGEKRAREVAVRFEHMRSAFGVLFQKVSVNTAPLAIIAFRNSKELRQIAPLYEGKPITIAGFFLGAGGHAQPGNQEDRQYIALDLSAEDNWGVVFHEYAHLLINSNFPPTPVWFDEGFAEYCSSLKVDKKEIAIGLVRPELPQVLSQNRWLKLVDLFSVGHDSKIYNRDDRRSVFYAQSWITVHFLMSKNLMKQMSAYNHLVQDQHVPVPEAIRRGFAMEPEQLEKAIEAYFRTGSALFFHAPAPPGIDNIAFTSRTLDDLSIKSLMADLDFHSRDYRERGIASFEEILKKQPENVLANRGLGYAALQKNDWERAGLYFKRAADSATKDPQVHYLLALWMSRKSGALGGAPEELEAMKKELTAAVTLDPDYADAYSLLGMTLSNAGDTASAGDALKKAMALNPRNEWYAFNLANVYLRSQDFDQALPLLKQLQLSSDQQIARMAAMQLAQAETYARYSAHRDQEPRTEAAPQDEEESNPRLVELEKPAAPVATAPISFLKGTLVSVDCAQAPAAVLTIASGGKQWKMLAPQAKKLVVMGADELSCSWSNKRVAVNFRKTGEAQGQLVSLELQ